MPEGSPRSIELHIETVSKSGPAPVVRGRVAGEPAIIKFAARPLPWSEIQSAFFGGKGLAAPFVPLVLHEAAAWHKAFPDRLLGAGLQDGCPFVAIRDCGGSPLRADAADVERMLFDVAGELATLHAAGIVHRDLRPDNVLLTDAGYRLVDLDICFHDGLGPGGVLSSAAWRAPELLTGPGEPRTDLFALGRLAAWMITGAPGIEIPAGHRHRELITALCAVDIADRPRSARAVLNNLGGDGPAAAALTPPHPILAQLGWSAWVPVLIAAGRGWDVVRYIDDAADIARWALAGAAGRVLAEAGRIGGEMWLILAALCDILSERSTGDVAMLHAAQRDEAVQRAARPWHPAAQAYTLVGGPRDGKGHSVSQRVAALCSVGRFTSARRHAERVGAWGDAALAAYRGGDAESADRYLARCHMPDLTTARVAVSRTLDMAPAQVDVRALPLAEPSALRRAVIALHEAGDSAAIDRMLDALSGSMRARISLTLALRRGDGDHALTCALELARQGAWDPVVAAVIALHVDDNVDADASSNMRGQGIDPDVIAAAHEVLIGIVAESHEQAARLAAQALVGGIDDPANWWFMLRGMVAKDSGEAIAFALSALDVAGSIPARILGGQLISERVDDAVDLLERSASESADPWTHLQLVATCILAGQIERAVRWAERLIAEDAMSYWNALAMALTALARREHDSAAAWIGTACVLGAPQQLIERIRSVRSDSYASSS